MFLKISRNSQENTCGRVSFLKKLQARARNFIKKETLAQVISCEFCEISKNTFLNRTPLVVASWEKWCNCWPTFPKSFAFKLLRYSFFTFLRILIHLFLCFFKFIQLSYLMFLLYLFCSLERIIIFLKAFVHKLFIVKRIIFFSKGANNCAVSWKICKNFSKEFGSKFKSR